MGKLKNRVKKRQMAVRMESERNDAWERGVALATSLCMD